VRLVAALGLLAAVAGSGCAGVRSLVSPVPQGSPTERSGWLAWGVGGLRFEAPAGWVASGDTRRLTLDAGGEARLEALAVEGAFADRKACLSAAEEALARGEAQLSRVRRHQTTLAGHPAVVQEADAGGWHGWAYAVCDGGEQHRLFFTGRSPIPAELLEAWRGVVKSARVGGGRDGA
jgi:predicted Zn-dependent protease